MKHRIGTHAVLFVAFLGLCIGLQAQVTPAPFSADMAVKTSEARNMVGKFYYNGQKLRMDFNADQGNAVMIHNTSEQVTYLLMPERKMYMEMRAGQNGIMRNAPDLRNMRAFDANHPCATFTDLTCERVGSETVNGRSTEKWIFTDKKTHESSTVWIDKKLNFPIKIHNQDRSEMELSNIQDGTPSSSLFEIPAGYHKFDMGMMGGQRPQ